jgi:parvulin-like peptidyl-prolyl isomerase
MDDCAAFFTEYSLKTRHFYGILNDTTQTDNGVDEMYCKYCGQPLEDDADVCAACGKAQNDAPAQTPAAPPAADQVSLEAEEITPAHAGIYYDNIALNREEQARQQSVPEEPVKKKSKGPAIAAVVVALCLVIGIVAAAFVLTRDTTTDGMDTVVMTCEGQDLELTNAELSYYFWSEYYYLLSYYGDYITIYTGLDTSVALSEQQYSDDQTWQEYLTDAAISSAQETMSFVYAANEAGFTLDGEYLENLNTTLENFESYAADYGFTDENGNADVLAYLQDSYGEGATYDSFVQYLTDSYLCAAYSNYLYNEQTYTDEEVSDYYDQHADEYESAGVDKTTRFVNVRHVLLECDMDDEEAAAETLAQAQALLDTWLAEDGTEEGFAAMAEEYSTDGGSNTNGGLYEDVYPGQMVTNFNDWCFDADRAVGDTGIVETSYGYHIMYFSGFGDEYWYQSALADLSYEAYENAYLDITSRYTFTVADASEIVIATPTGYTVE